MGCRINRNRSRRIYGDARDTTELPDRMTYTELMRIERESKNGERAARADRIVKMAEFVLAGLVRWGAPGFEPGDMTIDDMHTSHYFARMDHEEVDRLLDPACETSLTSYPEDVVLEISLYRIADREMKKIGDEGDLGKEQFLKVLGRG